MLTLAGVVVFVLMFAGNLLLATKQRWLPQVLEWNFQRQLNNAEMQEHEQYIHRLLADESKKKAQLQEQVREQTLLDNAMRQKFIQEFEIWTTENCRGNSLPFATAYYKKEKGLT